MIEQQNNRLEQLLRDEAYEAPQNEWFTPRVLNRLPRRRSAWRWVPYALYALAGGLTLLCWLYLLAEQDYTVLTVRDITHFVAMLAVTAIVVWQAVDSIVSHVY